MSSNNKDQPALGELGNVVQDALKGDPKNAEKLNDLAGDAYGKFEKLDDKQKEDFAKKALGKFESLDGKGETD